MRPNGRNKGPTMAIVDKSSKLFSCNDGEGCEAQVRDYLVANKDVIVRPTGKDGRIERFGKDESILRGSGAPLGTWWKSHILSQRGEEGANVAFLDDSLNLCKAL